MDFAERVTFMPVVHGGKLNNLESKWGPRQFAGIRPRSGEKFVMTKEGVAKARTILKLPVIDRWVSDDWGELQGVPWSWKPVRPRLPGIAPIPVSDARGEGTRLTEEEKQATHYTTID